MQGDLVILRRWSQILRAEPRRMGRPPERGAMFVRVTCLHPKTFTIADIGCLFDHLVGAAAGRCRDLRPSAFAVLRLMISSNLVGCSTGRSAGLAPLKILSDVGRGAAIEVGITHAVGEQASGLDELSSRINGRQPVPCRQAQRSFVDWPGTGRHPYKERVDALFDRRFERAANVVSASHIEKLGLDTQGARRRFRLFPLRRSNRVAHIMKQRNSLTLPEPARASVRDVCWSLR